MLVSQLFQTLKQTAKATACSRNIGVLAPALQKASDPIQQLFIDKVREYNQKSQGGKQLVEPTSDLQRELKSELEKAAKQYGAEGKEAEFTKFPNVVIYDFITTN